MALAVGTGEPADDVLESVPGGFPPPRRARRAWRLLRGIARLTAGLGAESACLLAAVTLSGWSVTSAPAAIAGVVALTALAGRPTLPVSLAAGLSALMLENWLFAPVPVPPSAAWLAAGCCYAVLAWVVRGLPRAVRQRRRAPRRVAVIGTGEHGARLARTLLEHPEYGFNPVGLIGDDLPGDGDALPVLGGYSTCLAALRRWRVDTAVVAGNAPISRELLRRIGRGGCQVLLAPAPGELVPEFAESARHLHGYALIPMRPVAQRRPYWLAKRAADVTAASLALVVAAPLLALCLLAVRLEGGPGVLFRQRRVGMDGRHFDMLKIRTLKPTTAHDSATQWTVSESRLSGPIGGFLRKTSLDELPQLWNVITGDMSLVGPRPERPFFVDQFSRQIDRYGQRHRVPVGITGWAQVHGLRGDTSLDERARLDNYYIDEWSLWLDVKIILRTIGCVLRLGGA